MKIKQPRRWKKQTVEEQQTISCRIIGFVFWILFLVVGVVALVSACTTGDWHLLSNKPTCSPSLLSAADTALTNRIPGRSMLLRTVTNSVAGTGGNRIGDVYLTDDRLLECPAQLDEENLTDTANTLNQFYNIYQIPTYVIAVPPAGEFYADELMEGMSYPSQMTAINEFYRQIASPIRKIDVYHVLFTATDDYIYNRTDPRWSCYGAYCVYRSAIQKMGFASIPYDQYVVTHAASYRGSLYDACLYRKVTPDILDIYTCESGSHVTEMTAYLEDGTTEERQVYESLSDKSADPYSFYLGDPCEKLIIRTDLDNQKKLLLLKDSYADCMVPFLLQHYSEICILDVTLIEGELISLTDVSDYSQVLVLCDADTFAEPEAFAALTAGEEKTND